MGKVIKAAVLDAQEHMHAYLNIFQTINQGQFIICLFDIKLFSQQNSDFLISDDIINILIF